MKDVVNIGELVHHLKSCQPLEVTLDGNKSWISIRGLGSKVRNILG